VQSLARELAPASVAAMLKRLIVLLSFLFLAAFAAQAENAITAATTDPVSAECKRIGKKLSSVSVRGCLSHNLQDSGARSVKGQPILIKEYPPLPKQRQPIGRVLLIGGTHGDEYAAVSIVFKWMQTLDKFHSGMFHWHVTPLLNPDGLLLNKPSVRLNANGVDLNRNMPTPDWHRLTAAYWNKTGHDPRRYPGTDPLSEPESRWLYEEIRSFQPDAIVSVHAPFGILDFDGPPVGPDKLGYLHLKLIGTYPGSLGNCAGVQHEIPVITVELPYAGIMPTRAQISNMWTDLVRWLQVNIPKEETIAAYSHFDATTNQLLARKKDAKPVHELQQEPEKSPATPAQTGQKNEQLNEAEQPAATPSADASVLPEAKHHAVSRAVQEVQENSQAID